MSFRNVCANAVVPWVPASGLFPSPHLSSRACLNWHSTAMVPAYFRPWPTSKVGEVVKADPGVVVKLANIGDHEGAETY